MATWQEPHNQIQCSTPAFYMPLRSISTGEFFTAVLIWRLSSLGYFLRVALIADALVRYAGGHLQHVRSHLIQALYSLGYSLERLPYVETKTIQPEKGTQ